MIYLVGYCCFAYGFLLADFIKLSYIIFIFIVYLMIIL